MTTAAVRSVPAARHELLALLGRTPLAWITAELPGPHRGSGPSSKGSGWVA